VRHIRPDIRRVLLARVVLHSACRHARRRRKIDTDSPTQFTLPFRPILSSTNGVESDITQQNDKKVYE